MADATRLRLVVLLVTVFSRICSGIPTAIGCFSSKTPLVQKDSSNSQDIENCNDKCIATTNNQLVLAVSGTDCWCGNVLPKASSQVEPRNCNIPCPGNNTYYCGGTDYFTVWLTELGTEAGNVPNFSGSSAKSTTSSPTSTPTTSTKTQTNNTPTGTQGNSSPTGTKGNSSPTGAKGNSSPTGTKGTNSPTGTKGNNSPTGTQDNNSRTTSSSSGSPQATGGSQPAKSDEKAKDSSESHGDADIAIAVGVVIGVVALALLGFIFWWVWRRRRQTGSFSRYQDSVDGSMTGLQKRGPSPESSNAPEMMAADSIGPSIMVQRPTPGLGSPTDSVYSGSVGGTAAPLAAAAPVVAAPAALAVRGEPSLHPPAAREVSRASSNTDPFYTPLEQPSISHFNQTELNSLKAQTPHDSTSESDFEEDSDTLSPLEDIRAPAPQRNNSRNLPYAYSSEYDFADGNTPMMPGNMPGYFPVGRDWGGRIELP